MQTEHLEVRASTSLLQFGRVGIVVPKYGKPIVERNKLRRRLREIVRAELIPRLESANVLIQALPNAYTASFDELKAQLDEISQKLGRGV